MSDLHLESQEFPYSLSKCDVLIVAGDLCGAVFLDPARNDIYSHRQRDRVFDFIDMAKKSARHVLLVAGNHEHYQGVFDETVGLMKSNLDGVTVLDNEFVDIDGVRFFGMTLWTDFNGRSEAAMQDVRRSVGEFLLVKKRRAEKALDRAAAKFQPEDALEEFDKSLAALRRARDDGFDGPMVVISHHAPSLRGLNAIHRGNGLDAAYASDLETFITELENVPYWVHGHTHIKKRYRIGDTQVVVNCLGFVGREDAARTFSADTSFKV